MKNQKKKKKLELANNLFKTKVSTKIIHNLKHYLSAYSMFTAYFRFFSLFKLTKFWLAIDWLCGTKKIQS